MTKKTYDAKTGTRPTEVKSLSKSGKSSMTAVKKKASKVQMQDFHFVSRSKASGGNS